MSRLRVAAAACLIASALLAGGSGGAVAFAGPDETDGAGGTGTVGDGSGAAPAGTAEPGPTTDGGTRPQRQGRFPRPPRVTVGNGRDTTPPKIGDTADSGSPSKQLGSPGDGATGAPGEPAGEPGPPTDPGGAGPADPGGADDPDDPGGPDDPDDPDDCDKEGRHCLPWWWPKPGAPKSGNGNGGLGSAAPRPPAVRPIRPPVMHLPEPRPNGALPAPPTLPAIIAPVPALPVIEPPPLPAGSGGAGGSGAAPPPAAPVPPEPPRPRAPQSPPTPAQAVDRAVVPASYRAGYGDYLRTADMPQVVAVAVPGVTGMMLLTAVGGIIGYRQARSALASSSRRSARFTS
jgi:hypothetical protein